MDWITQKVNAKRLLLNNFIKDEDYILFFSKEEKSFDPTIKAVYFVIKRYILLYTAL